jgi:predicted Fe-Mo cluster-binding NifX family protein
MNTNHESIRVVFAVSNNNKFEEKHFGDADKYLIYQWQGEQFLSQTELINHFKNSDESNEHGSKLKGSNIISFLKNEDVNILVSKQFGKNIKMVNKHFIPVVIASDTINDACKVLIKNMKQLVEGLQKEQDNYKLIDLRTGSVEQE